MTAQIIEPYTFSQFVIDAYFETDSRKEFIDSVSLRYPQVKSEILEAFWQVIDFMVLAK